MDKPWTSNVFGDVRVSAAPTFAQVQVSKGSISFFFSLCGIWNTLRPFQWQWTPTFRFLIWNFSGVSTHDMVHAYRAITSVCSQCPHSQGISLVLYISVEFFQWKKHYLVLLIFGGSQETSLLTDGGTERTFSWGNHWMNHVKSLDLETVQQAVVLGDL